MDTYSLLQRIKVCETRVSGRADDYLNRRIVRAKEKILHEEEDAITSLRDVEASVRGLINNVKGFSIPERDVELDDEYEAIARKGAELFGVRELEQIKGFALAHVGRSPDMWGITWRILALIGG